MPSRSLLDTVRVALQQGNRGRLAECFQQVLDQNKQVADSSLRSLQTLFLAHAKTGNADVKVWDVIRLVGKAQDYKMPACVALEILKHNQYDKQVVAWLDAHASDFASSGKRGSLVKWCEETGVRADVRPVAQKLLAQEVGGTREEFNKVQMRLMSCAPEWVDLEMVPGDQVVTALTTLLQGWKNGKEERRTTCVNMAGTLWSDINAQSVVALPATFPSSFHKLAELLDPVLVVEGHWIERLGSLWDRGCRTVDVEAKQLLFKRWACEGTEDYTARTGSLLGKHGVLPLEPLLAGWQLTPDVWKNSVDTSPHVRSICMEFMANGQLPPKSTAIVVAQLRPTFSRMVKSFNNKQMEFAAEYARMGGDVDELLPEFSEGLQEGIKSMLRRFKSGPEEPAQPMHTTLDLI